MKHPILNHCTFVEVVVVHQPGSYSRVVDDNGLGAPNCPIDLVSMEAVGDGDTVRWECPICGLVQLA